MPALAFPPCQHTPEAREEAKAAFRGVCPCCLLEVVRKYYLRTQKLSTSSYNDAARRVLDALNAISGRQFRPVDANLRPIIARLATGITEAQCILVIEHQAKLWSRGGKGDFDGTRYLRPETLFRASKFEAYLADAEAQVRRRMPVPNVVKSIVKNVAQQLNVSELNESIKHAKMQVEKFDINGTEPDAIQCKMWSFRLNQLIELRDKQAQMGPRQ